MSDDAQEINALQAEVALGNEAEKFKRSAIGAHLIDKARDAVISGLEKLRRCDPFDPKAIVEAQLDIRVPELMVVWIEHAIEGGKDAASQLESREQESTDPV